MAAFVVVAVVFGLWMERHHLDVLALGRERATVLGVRYRRSVSLIMLSWGGTPVAKEDRIYPLDSSYWLLVNGGLNSMNKMLDDIDVAL